jgi:hypothetical protein
MPREICHFYRSGLWGLLLSLWTPVTLISFCNPWFYIKMGIFKIRDFKVWGRGHQTVPFGVHWDALVSPLLYNFGVSRFWFFELSQVYFFKLFSTLFIIFSFKQLLF